MESKKKGWAEKTRKEVEKMGKKKNSSTLLDNCKEKTILKNWYSVYMM